MLVGSVNIQGMNFFGVHQQKIKANLLQEYVHMVVKVQMPRDNVQLKLQYLQHVQMVAIQVPENVFYQDHHVQQAVL
jgi:hypothetical protein